MGGSEPRGPLTAFADLDRRIQVICARLDDRLPVDDHAFDIINWNNLLECIGDEKEFVAEVARILHPGGTVVAAHWDWDTQLFDAADRALVRRLMEAFLWVAAAVDGSR